MPDSGLYLHPRALGPAPLSASVMRPPSHSIVLLPIALVGLAAVVIATPKFGAPVVVSVVDVTDFANTKRVTVEFLQRDPAAVFAPTPTLQLRVAGRWKRALRFLAFEDRGYLFDRTNRQRFVFDFPLQTEACKVSLGYRVDSALGAKAYSFLSRHGFSEKFPAISESILECVQREPKLRHVEFELTIPAGRHNETRQPTPGERQACTRESPARRGCAFRWAALSV